MRKVIKGGIVITMDEKKLEKFEKLDIVIEDNVIKDLTVDYQGDADVIIDASNKIVMPGLINAHTHLGMSLFRATNDELTLNDWLNKKIWPIESTMTDEDVYFATLFSILEMLESGTTCSNNMYFSSEAAINAIVQTKVRSIFSECLMDNDDKGTERIETFKKLYEKYKDNDLVSFMVSPHSMYTCSKKYLKECSELALSYNVPVHIHFCENEDEVKKIKKEYHKSPVKALNKVGLLRNKLVLAHGTFISDKDLKLLNKKDISICHNPISNLNLGCGIADIDKYNNTLNICLGTDGQGSGNNLNMFYHMSLVDLLQKGLHKNPLSMNSYDVLKMATINGAYALGLEKEIGSIEVDKKADIIILDMNTINSYPSDDIINNIVHNTEVINIDTVMINGETLIQNHKLLLNINKDALKDKMNEMMMRLMK
ncbi:MAG: amidohydrolase [Bacilli bacterium]|nr:amidohydrolase [Bacilli bacterium]